ncbi:M13 family metallopeptidase [Sphingomonas sp.]|uniref:M13 family metallopeptidase n=1 Tax=Sphingomonas sp. TaxID=28214 RepID=UPI00286DD376|nr:M13 family metallopeptidase [Sphingomonas sp.]
MNRLTILFAAGTMLSGCAATTPPPIAAAPEAPAPPPAAAVPAAAPAAKIGEFGFDRTGMDPSVRPGDDFYEFANGAWAKRTPIPADKSNYGMFNALQDTSQERVRELLEAAKDDPASRIGAAYASFLDEAAVEARGLTPIQPWLDQIRGLDDRAGFAALSAKAARRGIVGLFAGGVGQDDRNSEVYIVGLGQAGLGMPDRDMYLLAKPEMAALRTAYLAHLTNVLTLAGEANAASRAKALLAFETAIAKVSWNREDSSDATKIYNKMTVAELARLAPGFDWATYLREGGVDVTELLVAQPSAFTGIAALARKAPLQVLRDQLIVRSLDAYADVLPKAVADEAFAFYGTKLNGTPQNQPRWKRAVDFTTNALTDEVSKDYVAKYFTPEAKAAMDVLVANVVAALGTRIEALDWMAPATKLRAKAKLAAFKSRVGYPEQWHDYSSVTIARDDLFGNAERANRWAYDWNVGKLGKPIYRWEWGLDPMTVNAQANSSLVAITFPAAILQPPFFDPGADPAINYGAIGAVIGHEISHHFDDQGAKYDDKGNLADWWTPQDVANFNARSKKLVEQYDKYEILPGEFLKGEFTLGENIGDLAGIQIAYDAYRKSLGGQEAPVIDGMTGDQRFYLGWAQVWRRNYREANLRSRILTDPHAPAIQRVWIVRNFDPWYQAFDVQPQHKLYLPPEQRVRIW